MGVFQMGLPPEASEMRKHFMMPGICY